MDFELLDSVKPRVDGKDKFQRFLIKRAYKEKVFSVCSLCDLAESAGDSPECIRCEITAEEIEGDIKIENLADTIVVISICAGKSPYSDKAL
jgi:hypothetical protein